MGKDTDFFDMWLESQKTLMDNWKKSAGEFQRLFSNPEGYKEAKKATSDIFNLYNSWIETVGKSFDEIIKNFPVGTEKDAFSKMFRGSDVYVKLYELWAPFYKTSLDKAFDADSFKEFFEPEKYKEVIDKVFGFNVPDTFMEFYAQASKMAETWGATSQNIVQPWMEAIQKNITEFPDLISGKPEAGKAVFDNMYNAIEKVFGQVCNIPSVGKDRENIELMMKCLEKSSKYITNNMEFQHQMYLTGKKAMERIEKEVSKKIKEGASIQSFDEYFKLWTEINDETYTELFETEAFSKLQAQLLDSALDTRNHFQKFMELSLKDFPVALRTEMNDVHKTLYDLKKKVRNLEKKVSSLSGAKKGTAK
jgi:class III poly(R)-hydroxyalkanoic acid synthase PhaE subunit